jgi:hypothetical protein
VNVKEVWTAKPMDASGTLALVNQSSKVGGFLCTSSTTGTLQITEGEASGGADIVAEMSVTAGTWYPMPFHLPLGAYAVLTSCAGTFAV